MKYFRNKNNVYSKLMSINLKLLILGTGLFVYKYVYDFRINQEMSLKLFTIFLFTLWILRILNNEEFYFEKTNLNLPILIFILLMTVSLLRSQFFMVSLNDYIIFLFYFLIYFLIINNINHKIQFDSLIKLFFITATIIAIYALMQYYGFDPYLKELSAITSTIGQKNWVSNYLVLIFPLIFSYFLLENRKKYKLYYYLSVSIIYATLMICQSRGIWISIICTFLIGIFLIYKYKIFDVFKKNKKWMTLIILTFLLITIIYSTDNPLNKSYLTIPQRALTILDEQDPSINTRLLIWKTTFEMIKDYPLLGTGIGTFKINYLYYQAKYLNNNSGYIRYLANAKEAHNEYLQIAAEMGLFGLGVFGLIIYTFYTLIINFIKKKNNDLSKREINGDENTIIENGNCKIISLFENQEKDKIIVFGLLMGVTCFLIHSLFCFPLHVPALGLTFFIIIGLTLAYIKNISSLKYQMSVIIKKKIFKNKKIKIFCIFLVLFFMIFTIDLLVIKPYLSEIYYFKGMKYNDIKNYEMPLPNLKYAAQLNPYNGRLLHALGTTYYNLNIFDKGEKLLQNAKKYITDVNIFYNLGLLYSKIGAYEKAEEELKQSIYLIPNFSKGYHYLGFLYFSEEDYDGAIEQWNKILEIEPNLPNRYIVLNNLGIAYNKKQMPDKALEYFVQALQLVPEDDPIEKEIEEEINKIYKSNLEK